MATATPSPKILTAPSSLRSYLKSHLSFLRKSSLLVISSSPPTTVDDESRPPPPATTHDRDASYAASVSEHVERQNFALTAELNLRSVRSSVSAAFATRRDVDGAVELGRRVGADVVVGIGSGVAMDVAKIVRGELSVSAGTDFGGGGVGGEDGIEGGLILSPATLAGFMACGDEDATILSEEEGMLLSVSPPATTTSSASTRGRRRTTAVVALDVDGVVPSHDRTGAIFARGGGGGSEGERTVIVRSRGGDPPPTVAEACLASVAVGIDAARAFDARRDDDDDRDARNDELYWSLVGSAIRNGLGALRPPPSGGRSPKDATDLAARAMLDAGTLLRTSKTTLRRTILPWALSCALVPSYFPRSHLLTFLSSSLPGLCTAVVERDRMQDVGMLARATSLILNGVDDDASNLADWAETVVEKARVPTMASLAEGAPNAKDMMEQLDAYHALSDCDINSDEDEFLEEVLHRSLNR